MGDIMMIDTHCHLNYDDYENLEDVITKMQDNIIIVSGTNDKTNLDVIKFVNKYKNVYGVIGIHPEYVNEVTEKSFEIIEKNINNPKIVGIGEVGLDYYWIKDNKKEQLEIFIKQIKLANKYNKTLVIHSREAISDTYNILKQYLKTKAVLHCYSSSLEMANKFIDLGIKLGIGGVVTFKNSKQIKEIVENIDLKHLLLETDSPYLTPEPNRGKKNEPYNSIYVASKIAEIKKISLDEVLEVTTTNAISQFDLML